jgi:hypothetical protein
MSCKKSLIIVSTLLFFLTAASTIALAKKPSKFKVSETVYAAGIEIKSGEYAVTWESNSPKATVLFTADGKTVAKAEGKAVEMNKVSEFDTLVLGQDASGRKTVKEIRFAGGKTAIVFE